MKACAMFVLLAATAAYAAPRGRCTPPPPNANVIVMGETIDPAPTDIPLGPAPKWEREQLAKECPPECPCRIWTSAHCTCTATGKLKCRRGYSETTGPDHERCLRDLETHRLLRQLLDAQKAKP